MFYVIDAVRCGADGHISHLKWHGVDADGEALVHTPEQVVPVVDAAQVCSSREVRVYVAGETGHFFTMKACADGIGTIAARCTTSPASRWPPMAVAHATSPTR